METSPSASKEIQPASSNRVPPSGANQLDRLAHHAPRNVGVVEGGRGALLHGQPRIGRLERADVVEDLRPVRKVVSLQVSVTVVVVVIPQRSRYRAA